MLRVRRASGDEALAMPMEEFMELPGAAARPVARHALIWGLGFRV